MNKENERAYEGRFRRLSIATGILTMLFLGAVILAWSFWAKSNKYENETANLVAELKAMDQSKLALQDTVGKLEDSYQHKISENEILTSALEERVAEVNDLQKRVRTVRDQLSKSQEINEQINQRLAQLEELKISLEEDIEGLQEQNLEIRSANNEIAVELTLSREQAAELSEDLKILDQKNDQLVSRLFQLAPAGFVAENFKVSAMQKNAKITTKAGRANEISVTFDIKNVPVEYQVSEELYLVITHFDGNPVSDIAAKNVKIGSQSPIDVSAVDIEQIRLSERQSVEMSFSPGKKFEGGLYNALVYADHGFLGATSFELR